MDTSKRWTLLNENDFEDPGSTSKSCGCIVSTDEETKVPFTSQCHVCKCLERLQAQVDVLTFELANLEEKFRQLVKDQ